MIANIIISKEEVEKIIREKLAIEGIEVLSVDGDISWSDQFFEGLVVKVKVQMPKMEDK